MLLFLFIFCSYYVLLSCDDIENAKFNESLLLYKHRQNLLEVNHLLRDLELKTKELSLLLETEYQNDEEREKFLYENITNGLRSEISEKNWNNKTKNLTNFSTVDVFRLSAKYDPISPHPGLSSIIPGSQRPPVISQLSPNQIGQATRQSNLRELPSLENVLKSMHPINPGLQSQLLTEKGFSRPISVEEQAPHHTPRLSTSYKRISSKNRLVYKESPLSLRIRHIDPIKDKVFRPLFDTDLSDPQNLKAYPPDSTIPLAMKTTTIGLHAKIWLQEIAPYTRRRRRRKRILKDQTVSSYHQRPTAPKYLLMSEPEKHWFSTGTLSTVHLYIEDEHGSLHKTAERPVQIPEAPNENWMTTTTRDVLHATPKEQESSTTLSPDQRYQELMKHLGEGYLMVFIIEMFRLIAVKDKREVREVLAHVESIYNTWLESGRLFWLKDPLRTVIGNLTAMTSDENHTDLVRSVSTVMFHSLLERKQGQSPEQSSMIDLAKSFYGDADGRRLLCSLKQFEEYPKTTKSSYQICESLIEGFLQPLLPPVNTRRRERLLNSITRALKQTYPHLFANTNIERSNDKGKSIIASTLRKRKHHHYHHKKKRKRRKRRLKPEYYNKPH